MTKQKTSLNKIYTIVTGQKQRAVILFCVTLLVAVCETLSFSLLVPLLGIIVNDGRISGIGKFILPVLNRFPKENGFWIILFLFGILIFFKSVLLIFHSYLKSIFVWCLGELWTNQVMMKYMKSPYTFFIKKKQGTLLHNILKEPATAAKALLQCIQFMTQTILALALFILLLVTNWKITISLLLFGLAVSIPALRKTKNFSSQAGKLRISLSQKLSVLANENISGFSIVKAFSLENLREEMFRSINKKTRDIRVKIDLLRAIPTPIGELLAIMALIGYIALLNFYLGVDIRQIIPVLGLFAVVARRLINTCAGLFMQRMSVYYSIPSMMLLHDLLYCDVGTEVLEQGEEFNKLKTDILLDHITFGYNTDHYIFNDMKINIPRGEMTAFVGPSGAGKTTIIGLLLGFLKPIKGDICINDKSLSNYSLSSWRSRIGYVSQDTFLFNVSIKENIRMGKPKALDEEIIEAAKKSAIHDFIMTLPKDYDTEVGDRGARLSGGQRQRIAIARAILRNPDIYIFDEATSALDNESEKLIQKSIESLSKEKTVVVIAHRLSTIENADNTYDLKKM